MNRRVKPGIRRFEDMDQQELEMTLIDLEQQVIRLQAEITMQQTDARATGKTWDIRDFPKTDMKLKQLRWLVSKVKQYLPKKQQPVHNGSTEAEDFMRVAKLLLEPGLYDHILESTRSR